jgi:hypothetical protein
MDSRPQRPSALLERILYAAHGVYLILAGLALAVLCWLIPALLGKAVSSEMIDPARVQPLAQRVLDHRDLMPLAALPAVIFGVVALTRVPLRWLWVLLGFLSLLVPAAVLLYTFVVTIGLLYT